MPRTASHMASLTIQIVATVKHAGTVANKVQRKEESLINQRQIIKTKTKIATIKSGSLRSWVVCTRNDGHNAATVIAIIPVLRSKTVLANSYTSPRIAR